MDLFDDLESDERRRLAELAQILGERSGETPGRSMLRALERAASVPEALEPTGPGFELRLFGHPRVLRHGAGGSVHEVAWRLRRSLQTVIYLALAPGRRASKDELVDALWPRASHESVAKNFHPTLSDVRRSLSGGHDDVPTLAYRAGVYVLDETAGETASAAVGSFAWHVDVDRFEALLDSAQAARRDGRTDAEMGALEAAWKLYRGPLVSDLEAPWIERRRSEARRAWLAALDRLGTLASENERHVLALDAWRRLLIEEPFEERVHLGVMELYGRRGRRDLVRRQYVKLQEHLAELEVEPARETQTRYLELMR